MVIAAGANACGFEESADDTSRSRVGSGHDPCFVPCVDAARCPPPLPSYKLALSELETAGGTASKWSAVSKLPGGGGRDVPNAAAVPSGVNGGLYVFGGWRANSAGQAAWKQLYGLDLPVPIAKGTNGARLLRDAYKYNATQDKWERLPDAPMHVAQVRATAPAVAPVAGAPVADAPVTIHRAAPPCSRAATSCRWARRTATTPSALGAPTRR